MSKYFPVTHSTLSVKALMTEVLSDYEIDAPTKCKLLNRGLNDTYLIQTNDTKYILRVYRAGWRSLSDILYELEVLLHLKRAGIAVSVPLPRKDGHLTTVVTAPEGVRYIVLFTYAPGKELAYESAEEIESYLYGNVVAQIHTATDRFHSQHKRFSLDFTYLLDGPLRAMQPLLVHRPEDWDYVQALAERLRTHVLGIPVERLEQGFCHGDFHGWNAHIAKDHTLTVFDFDCCGEGWRAYDIAVFRWGARLRDKEQARWPAFLRGYRETRNLSDIDVQATPYFVAVRHLWLVGLHTANGHDWGFGWMHDRYFDRAIKFLRDWEAEYLMDKPMESDVHQGDTS
jgi:Ser/Thr protein kinase RdoA (MazF antagonist)